METIGSRIKQFAKENYKSVSGLARAMGLGTTALAPYIKGKIKPGAILQQKLREVGCDIEWLMTGVFTTLIGLDSQVIRIKPMKDSVKIPVVISSEEYCNLFLINEVGALYTEPAKFYDETSFYIIVNDKSIAGHFGINDCDWLLISTKVPPIVGNVVLAAVHGKTTVKRLIKKKEDLFLESDSAQDSLIPFDENSVKILGVIMKIERMIRCKNEVNF